MYLDNNNIKFFLDSYGEKKSEICKDRNRM